jgi:hypothetical protein
MAPFDQWSAIQLQKSLRTARQRLLQTLLIDARKASGLTQWDVAAALASRSRSSPSMKMESVESTW